jgi:hypothetical protein
MCRDALTVARLARLPAEEDSRRMPNYVDPALFKDQPLLMKRIGEDDYSVRIAGHG